MTEPIPDADLHTHRRRWLTALTLVALLLAAAYFTIRGPVRGVALAPDFKELYAPARALLAGENGYNLNVAREHWMDAGAGPQARPAEIDLGLLYPPSSMVLLAPIATADWPVARYMLAAVNVLMSIFIVLGAVGLAGLRLDQPLGLGLVATVLALAPIHTAIAMGQPVLLAVAPVVWGVGLALRGRGLLSGLLLGFAAAIKVQLGAPFLLYFLCRGRWKIAAAGLLTFAVPTLIAVAVLQRTGADWFADWSANLSQMRDGGFADPTPNHPGDRHKMVNLYYPLYLLFAHRPVAELLALVLSGAAGVVLIFRVTRHHRRDLELLALSLVAVLSLLAVYHMFYDAALLALPVAFGFLALGAGRRGRGVVTLMLCAPFAVPGAVAISQWTRAGRFPRAIYEADWFQLAVLPYQNWLLLILAAALLAMVWRETGPKCGPAPSDRIDQPEGSAS